MATCISKSKNHVTSSFISDDHSCQINSTLCKLIRICNTTPRAFSNKLDHDKESDPIWLNIQRDALVEIRKEPILSNYYVSSISCHSSLESALANQLAIKLSCSNLSKDVLFQVFLEVLMKDNEITTAIRDDLRAIKDRDPACTSYLHCFLNLKGYLACQAHRISHKYWLQGRTTLSFLIQSQISEVFAVDIHPGARMGCGILLDHATGIVIGETAVIGDSVTILHNVTLGGTGKDIGDRHPKIGDGVFIGAGAKILGNVKIGEGAKIGAGAVVLKDVPPHATVVGNPARVVVAKRF